ncbi:DUF6443 domain-containing protein [Marinifilum caeruleilacunae]|uniref:DUF6443 domain-containing protein n=1 Tax=Marinifilum caeruleilacunae TaxID=2499076 RepID=A0ABX1WVI5_9BACT|nr:DUF6443 domain-containing protein [Marinifilum caeruleilacunae]NOU60119.1 hypothetical protein [Marinifilum caeruleilacunae]
MKYTIRTIMPLCFLLVSCLSFAQTQSKNYIKISRPQTTSGLSGKTLHSLKYFDGLGRVDQNIEIGATPNGFDLVQPFDYDELGREKKKFLPYALRHSNAGAYVASKLDPNKWAIYGGEKQYAYAETQFDASPLNRVFAQGAPGAAWQVSGNHKQRMDYDFNQDMEVLLFRMEGDDLEVEGFYQANSLHKSILKDENWNSGNLHTTEEFTDKEGKIILKRSYVEDGPDAGNMPDVVDTYYVYDDFGQLRYVLPPQLIATAQYRQIYASYTGTFFLEMHYLNNGLLLGRHFPHVPERIVGYVRYTINRNSLSIEIDINTVVYNSLGDFSLSATGKIGEGILPPDFYYLKSMDVATGVPIHLSVQNGFVSIHGGTAARLIGIGTPDFNNPFPGLVGGRADSYSFNPSLAGSGDFSYNIALSTTYPGRMPNPGIRVDRGWSLRYHTLITMGLPNRQYGRRNEVIARIPVISQALLNQFAYQYKYDKCRRMTHKKLPGADWIYMLYDKRDRLVLSQDGNQRHQSTKEWMYTLYNDFNQPVETGSIRTNASFLNLQTSVGNSLNYVPSGRRAHTYTWYDRYGSEAIGFDAGQNISGSNRMTSIKGQVSTHKEKILGAEEGSWLTTSYYYDQKQQMIQSLQRLSLVELGRTSTFEDCISNRYDFTGKLTRCVQVHNSPKLSRPQRIDKELYYDHAGRLTQVYLSMSGAINKARTKTLGITYNELGQLQSKSYHNGQQTCSYRYNIRGWLTHINDPYQIGNKLFAMKLLYNNSSELRNVSNRVQYNGNIAAMLWKSKNSVSGNYSNLKAYGFIYDALNRLKTADYEEKTSSWSNSTKYDLGGNANGISYDLNGNILHLKRNNSGTGVKDQFRYRYQGNQLMALGENGRTAPAVNEFSYDYNGNMTANSNQGIRSLAYNQLNLPKSMSIGSNSVRYEYSAGGLKIKNSINNRKLYYISNFVYEGSSLKYILHDEGRFVVNHTENGGSYEYHLKDHLGNTRVAFLENQSRPVQSVDYYPFGLCMNLNQASTNKYLFNGKELQEETEWLDFHARMYDGTIVRTTTPDPHLEGYYSESPYSLFGNNPINNIDPTGMDWYRYIDEDGNNHYTYRDGSDETIEVDDNTYSNIGANVSIQLGEGYYFNAFQNYGVTSLDGAINVKQKILNDPELLGKLLSEGSGFSAQGQEQIMGALIHGAHADFINHPVTQATIHGLLFVATGGIEGAASILGTGRSLLARSTAKGGQTIIGEGMKRVSVAAARSPGSTILNNMPHFSGSPHQITSQMMQYNRRWLLQQMRSGKPIMDIGFDPTRGTPSIFYQMERKMINNYLKLHPNAFKIIKP